MDLTEMLHEPTGMSFRKWLDDAHGLQNKEPIGLVEIRDVFNSVDPYDHRAPEVAGILAENWPFKIEGARPD